MDGFAASHQRHSNSVYSNLMAITLPFWLPGKLDLPRCPRAYLTSFVPILTCCDLSQLPRFVRGPYSHQLQLILHSAVVNRELSGHVLSRPVMNGVLVNNKHYGTFAVQLDDCPQCKPRWELHVVSKEQLKRTQFGVYIWQCIKLYFLLLYSVQILYTHIVSVSAQPAPHPPTFLPPPHNISPPPYQPSRMVFSKDCYYHTIPSQHLWD